MGIVFDGVVGPSWWPWQCRCLWMMEHLQALSWHLWLWDFSSFTNLIFAVIQQSLVVFMQLTFKLTWEVIRFSKKHYATVLQGFNNCVSISENSDMSAVRYVSLILCVHRSQFKSVELLNTADLHPELQCSCAEANTAAPAGALLTHCSYCIYFLCWHNVADNTSHKSVFSQSFKYSRILLSPVKWSLCVCFSM